MKEKILQELKTKYSNLGLSDEVLGSVAEFLAKSVTKDEEVSNAVSGAELTLKTFQSQFDKIRGEKSTMQKELDELKKKVNPNDPPKPTDPPKEDKPLTREDIIAIMAEQLKPVNERFTKADEEAKKAERLSEVMAKAKEYKIPEAVAKYMSVPDDANLDDFMKTAKQDFSNNGFSEVTPPESAEAQVKTDSENIAKLITEGTKSIVEKEKTKN